MSNRKRLVLVGAGHAHLETIIAIRELTQFGYDVSVISLGSYLYYSGMGPGLLSGYYTKDQARFDVRSMVESRGGTFVDGRVDRIDAERRTLSFEDGSELEFDIASFAVGSVIGVGDLDATSGNVYTAKPIENLYEAGRRIENGLTEKSLEVVVSGGGASGVEIASNAALLGDGLQNVPTVSLITRGKVLRRFPGRVQAWARRVLRRRNVRVIEDAEVTRISPTSLTLKDGTDLPYAMILLTTGTEPPPIFSESRIPVGETGGLLVNKFLQSPEYPYIFGGGDCIDFAPRPLQKVGVYAVRENGILLENFRALASGRSLAAFSPQSRYHLALNMGGGIGISYRHPFVFCGSAAFRLKETIDRKFMHHYQNT